MNYTNYKFQKYICEGNAKAWIDIPSDLADWCKSFAEDRQNIFHGLLLTIEPSDIHSNFEMNIFKLHNMHDDEVHYFEFSDYWGGPEICEVKPRKKIVTRYVPK